MTDASRTAVTPAAPISMPQPERDPARRIRGAIDNWFAKHIHDSPVSRSVEALNHLQIALGHLETDIVHAIKTEI